MRDFVGTVIEVLAVVVMGLPVAAMFLLFGMWIVCAMVDIIRWLLETGWVR